MSNGDKPVAGCHLCGHGGPVQFSETCICDCHKPQPAVTEGPYTDYEGGANLYVGGPGLESEENIEARSHSEFMNIAFAQGASSKRAEVDKLKAENEGLKGALEEILGSCDGDLCADMNHHEIARDALSAHRDGEGVGG